MRISDWSSDVCSSDLHREIMERLIPLWAVLGVALVLMGVDLGGRLLWTLPMIGYVFGVMAVDHGPDYRRRFLTGRSEERRVGKECVSTCSSRWSQYH